MTTRRHFLAAAAALPTALRALAATPVPHWLLMGTDKGKGVYRAPWNAQTGEIGQSELVAETDHPTYAAKHPTLPLLYVANEGDNGHITRFVVKPGSGNLAFLDRVPSLGGSPCHLSIDRTGKSLFSANYSGGNLAAFRLTATGALHQGTTFDCNHNASCGTLGPLRARQEAAHMHCAVVSPDNKYVVACNLGADALEVFPFNAEGSSVVGNPTLVRCRPGSGPRHVAFHPNRRWSYVIHELDCTLQVFDWANGTLTPRANSVVSTLPQGVKPNAASDHPSTACELLVSPDGRFLYANTRGASTPAVYRIDAHTGLLTEQQRVGVGGTVTRILSFDPSRRFLLCANQGSSTVTVFSHDQATGRLSAQPRTFAAQTPMFFHFV